MLSELELSKTRAIIVHLQDVGGGKVKIRRITPSRGKFPDKTLINRRLVHANRKAMRNYLKNLFSNTKQGSLLDRIEFLVPGIDLLVRQGLTLDRSTAEYLKKENVIVITSDNYEVILKEDVHYAWK